MHINELKEFLEAKTEKVIDPFLFNELSNIKEENDAEKGVKNKGVNLGDKVSNTTLSNKNDPFSIAPFSKEELQRTGLSEKEIKEILQGGYNE